MLIATLFMLNVKININLSKSQIEIKAREYGMEYKGEHKVIQDEALDNMKNEDVEK